MKYQCESVPAILQLGRNIVNNVFLCYITSHSHYLDLKYVRETQGIFVLVMPSTAGMDLFLEGCNLK